MKFSAFLLVSVATMLLFATAIDIEEVEFEMSMCERFSRYTVCESFEHFLDFN